MQTNEMINPIEKLTQDLKKASRDLSPHEARYLVDLYYQIQEYRKRAANQNRSNETEPNQLIDWIYEQMDKLEQNIRKAMDAYSDSHITGRWAKSIHGIGPVISAGLLAHIDIHKASTAGKIWRFAGLDPTITWKKGELRPWNARLKTLCWKIGESFVKVSGSDKDFYGQLYLARKAKESELNESGHYREQAANIIASKRIGKDTKAIGFYSEGKLPPGHLHSRAKRWAVKMFLSHWHWVAYESEFNKKPPFPFVIEHMGHTDFTPPPNWPMKESRRSKIST
jgi:hypothetical protein